MLFIKKRFIFSLITLCLTLFISLVVAELILRIFNLVPVEGLTSVDQTQFDSVPGVYAPNQSFVSEKNRNLPHMVTINSLGYRGDEFPRTRPANELRIFMAGDSFMFGDLVDDDQTLPYQIETLLREQCANVRTINGGLAGSTIIGQSEIIARADEVEPDIVILSFHENDIIDMRAPLWNRLATNRQLKSSFPLSIVMPTLTQSAIYTLVRIGVDRIRSNFQVSQPTTLSEEELVRDLQLREQTKADYLRKLREVKERLEDKGVAFIYVIFPSHKHLDVPDQGDDSSDKSVEWADVQMVLWAERSARQLGVATLNLQSGLRHGLSAPEAGYLLPYDGHPAPRGYEVAAHELAAFLPLRDAVSRKCRQ